MHDLYALKDKLVDELAEYGRKDLSESSLKTVDTLAHAAKNVIIRSCPGLAGILCIGFSGFLRHIQVS